MYEKQHVVNPGILYREVFDGGPVLANPDTGGGIVVNAVGHLIWKALARPLTQEGIVAHLMESRKKDVPVEQVIVDMESVSPALLPGGFISELPKLADVMITHGE